MSTASDSFGPLVRHPSLDEETPICEKNSLEAAYSPRSMSNVQTFRTCSPSLTMELPIFAPAPPQPPAGAEAYGRATSISACRGQSWPPASHDQDQGQGQGQQPTSHQPDSWVGLPEPPYHSAGHAQLSGLQQSEPPCYSASYCHSSALQHLEPTCCPPHFSLQPSGPPFDQGSHGALLLPQQRQQQQQHLQQQQQQQWFALPTQQEEQFQTFQQSQEAMLQQQQQQRLQPQPYFQQWPLPASSSFRSGDAMLQQQQQQQQQQHQPQQHQQQLQQQQFFFQAGQQQEEQQQQVEVLPYQTRIFQANASDGSNSPTQTPPDDGKWWTLTHDICPISHFPVRLLPYPPFRITRADRSYFLCDGLTLALQALLTGNYQAVDHPLSEREILALDRHLKKCKLARYRLQPAMRLQQDHSDEACEALRRLRALAQEKLESVRSIQSTRLQRLAPPAATSRFGSSSSSNDQRRRSVVSI
mmetsp:Transcript_76669/g.159516  ORF Transcript_76669/g.159516 Transcript_76669/m.159516 type:complete len:472 (+) Transcript_76669:177-1592(+)